MWQQVVGCLLQRDAPAGPPELAAMWQLVVEQGLVLYMSHRVTHVSHMVTPLTVGGRGEAHYVTGTHSHPCTMTGPPEEVLDLTKRIAHNKVGFHR
jgi:hypothetical protein